MTDVRAAKLVAGANYGFSFFERRAIVGGKSHLCTSTRGSFFRETRRVAVLGRYRARIGPKRGAQVAPGPKSAWCLLRSPHQNSVGMFLAVRFAGNFVFVPRTKALS